MYAAYVKRGTDIFLACTLLVLLAPIYLITALAVLIGMGRPFLFIQKRPGLHEKIFTIYKFRTMTDECDEHGTLLPDEQRLHGVGKLIRSLSLDELPQLFNVLKGDMSFVGPRPLLVEYLTLYNGKQKRRHDVKPGITGWAQVNGRNAISWKKKFEYDLYYVDNLSFGLDMKIIWLSIKKVLSKEGVSAEGLATTEKFDGTN